MVKVSSDGLLVVITEDLTLKMSKQDMVKCIGQMEAFIEVLGLKVFSMV